MRYLIIVLLGVVLSVGVEGQECKENDIHKYQSIISSIHSCEDANSCFEHLNDADIMQSITNRLKNLAHINIKNLCGINCEEASQKCVPKNIGPSSGSFLCFQEKCQFKRLFNYECECVVTNVLPDISIKVLNSPNNATCSNGQIKATISNLDNTKKYKIDLRKASNPSFVQGYSNIEPVNGMTMITFHNLSPGQYNLFVQEDIEGAGVLVKIFILTAIKPQKPGKSGKGTSCTSDILNIYESSNLHFEITSSDSNFLFFHDADSLACGTDSLAIPGPQGSIDITTLPTTDSLSVDFTVTDFSVIEPGYTLCGQSTGTNILSLASSGIGSIDLQSGNVYAELSYNISNDINSPVSGEIELYGIYDIENGCIEFTSLGSVNLVEPSDIPTLSQWGLIILALLLLTMASVGIVRQRQGVLAANQSALSVKTPLFNAQLFNKLALYSLPFIMAIVALISLYEGGFYLRNLVGTIISGLIVVYFIHFIMLSGFNTKK